MNNRSSQSIYLNHIHQELDRFDPPDNIVRLEETREQPIHDFRICIGNDDTVEEIMRGNAKSKKQMRKLLRLWKKTRTLLSKMIRRLDKDLDETEKIETLLNESKEKARELRMRSGCPDIRL